MTETTTRFCINCKHHVFNINTPIPYHACLRYGAFDPVDGTPVLLKCSESRSLSPTDIPEGANSVRDMYCGPEGRFFEQNVTPTNLQRFNAILGKLSTRKEEP